MKSSIFTNEQPSSNYEVISKDSIQSKTSCLDINPSQKLGLLSGMVEVSGAAKYLSDQKTSQRQSRVILHYSSTTYSEQLAVDQLGDVEYPQALNEDGATHVVSGIMYGADAFLVFDCPVKKSGRIDDVQKRMIAAIKSMSSVPQSMLDFSTHEFQCKFYGDFVLKSNPSTFNEAIKLYRDFPLLSTTKVPKLAYLLPLSKVTRQPQQTLHLVSLNLISQVEDIFEHFHHTEVHAYDLIEGGICHMFLDIKYQLSQFVKLLCGFKAKLVEKLCRLVPQIRSGVKGEKQLAELIVLVNESPYNSSETEKYLQCKDRELNILHQLLKNIWERPQIQLDFPGTECNLTALTNDDQIKRVACFAFNITSKTSPYIETLERYSQTGTVKPQSSDKEWFDSPQLIENLRNEIAKFLQLMESTPIIKNNFAFVVTDSSVKVSESGPCTLLYTGSVPTPFDPPGAPHATKVTMDSITLQWTAPKHVKVSSYKVLYCLKGELKFNSISNVGLVTTYNIKNLSHGAEYQFKVRAVTSSEFAFDSGITTVMTAEYYDIVLIGKTGQGKSTLGNKLLDLDNTDESKIFLFESTSTPVAGSSVTTATKTSSMEPTPAALSCSTPTSSITTKKKRFLQANDSEVTNQMLSVTKECMLISNEETNIRVLDVPGFSDSGTLQTAIGKEISVFDGNLQIIRWIVREQLRSQLKVRRVVYFLPVRGPLEKADGTMQEELQILHHYFGKEIFNSMVVVATNSPMKKFQDLGFDEDDYIETKKIFHLTLKIAIEDEDIACPPILYIGYNDSPGETLSMIKKAPVLKHDAVIQLIFVEDTCALCSAKIHCNENNEKVSVIDANGEVIPYAKSKCHPCFVPKYTTAEKLFGGAVHVFTMGTFLLLNKIAHIDSWPGFTNSDEVCIACNQSPGAKGCEVVGKELKFVHVISGKVITAIPEHSNKL